MDKKIAQIVHDEFGVEADVQLTRPEPQFGDYTTNVALQLAPRINKNPREVADQIAIRLRELGDFEEITVAGPGFINIQLTDKQLLAKTQSEPKKLYEGQSIVLEYSCPNAFKELHTGHLYQTLFGDILGRLLTLGGANLHRTSFGGDVGLHVAKCLWGIIGKFGGEKPEKLNEIDADSFVRARWISERYVEGAAAYEESDEAKFAIDELNTAIYHLHATNDQESALAQIYWTTRSWSLAYFDAFYDLLGVEKMRYYAESATAPTGLKVVKQQLQKGILVESDGAVVFEGDETKHLHTRVFVTSKGLPTYETKDIGVIWLERQDYQFDHRYIITGNDQVDYMRVLMAAAETFDPRLIGSMTHLANGTVRFGDGQKMSSRRGNVTRAIDVLDTVRQKVQTIVSDDSIVEDVSLGAIKYLFAKYRLGGDIAFDVNETVSLQGNSGPYLQYAHARARRILEKISGDIVSPTSIRTEDLLLVRKLSEYTDVINLSIKQLEPHHICTYLFELAQEFNRYYEKNHVIGSEYEKHRAGLVQLYANTLREGLSVLGIAAPEKM